VTAPGRRTWALAGGWMPPGSTGDEPEFTSRDQIALLNVTARDAQVRMFCHFADRDPVGPFCVTVPARRVRKVRFNDLVDPTTIPLATSFACIITADRPIVAQWARLDSRQAACAIVGTIAWPDPTS
jgi:hypothetical protein